MGNPRRISCPCWMCLRACCIRHLLEEPRQLSLEQMHPLVLSQHYWPSALAKADHHPQFKLPAALEEAQLAVEAGPRAGGDHGGTCGSLHPRRRVADPLRCA
mmetsp:Transcript_22171/g.51803  ORF Transcript_22171/g.51803 Transcript_22171/m.51803 type:complete len:102 (+) Transcript_22171:88-393(+)